MPARPPTNGNGIGRIVEIIDWISGQPGRFTKHDLADAIGMCHRSALRYLIACETVGLAVRDRPPGRLSGWGWRSGPRRLIRRPS